MKKLTAVLAIAALAVSSPALGGEITGNGGTANGGVKGASECSYSGLNDDPEIDGLGFTQTWASFWRTFIGFVDPGFFLHPGNACRGN